MNLTRYKPPFIVKFRPEYDDYFNFYPLSSYEEQILRMVLSNPFPQYSTDHYSLFPIGKREINKTIKLLKAKGWDFSKRLNYAQSLVQPIAWNDIFSRVQKELQAMQNMIKPESIMVVYVERMPHEQINRDILNHYRKYCGEFTARDRFSSRCFVYLPIYQEQQEERHFRQFINYVRPTESSESSVNFLQTLQSPDLIRYLNLLLMDKAELGEDITAALVEIQNGEISIVSLANQDQEDFISSYFNKLGFIDYSIQFSNEPGEDTPFELQKQIDTLTRYGSHEALIDLLVYLSMEFKFGNDPKINKLLISLQEGLIALNSGLSRSRVVIDKHHRILLPEFNNIEIEMSPLPQTLFLFFLQHPEGILFKRLSDYKGELKAIYIMLTNTTEQEKIDRSIDDLVDPSNNSLNEKCSRIKEAFLKKIDERLARYYYITGERGGLKRILIASEEGKVEYVSFMPPTVEIDRSKLTDEERNLLSDWLDL